MESRPQAAVQVQNTRRTLGVDCRYQPVSDRSVSTATCATSMPALWSELLVRPDVGSRVSSHRGHCAAVDADVGAVDETGPRTGEEGNEVRQFLDSSDAAQRIGATSVANWRSHSGRSPFHARALAISRIQLSSIGVSTGPGVIVLTVMPVPPAPWPARRRTQRPPPWCRHSSTSCCSASSRRRWTSG